MKTNKKPHGGAGLGQGRKFVYGEPSVPLGIRVPKSKYDEIFAYVDNYLEKYKLEQYKKK